MKTRKSKQKRKRATRRIINRENNRKNTFIKKISNEFVSIFGFQKHENFKITKKLFLYTYFQNKKSEIQDLLKYRILGLKQEIPKEKLIQILYSFLGHRGSTFENWLVNQTKEKNFQLIAKNNNIQEFVDWYSSIRDNKKEEVNKKNIEKKANYQFITMLKRIKFLKNKNKI